MNKKYLNLGCGNKFISSKNWTNLDFVSVDNNVKECNLLNGIPFENDNFDFTYSSHVLEHMPYFEGVNFLSEQYRVLKKGGVIRVVVPDLKAIIDNYLNFFNNGIVNLEDNELYKKYYWTLLELFDQLLRNKGGGNMINFINSSKGDLKDFISSRIGDEINNINKNNKPRFFDDFLKSLKKIFRFYFIGKFRNSGEIHQWMYDEYSLSFELNKLGFKKIKKFTYNSSYDKNWNNFKLDSFNETVRKPDSLFIEAIK